MHHLWPFIWTDDTCTQINRCLVCYLKEWNRKICNISRSESDFFLFAFNQMKNSGLQYRLEKQLRWHPSSFSGQIFRSRAVSGIMKQGSAVFEKKKKKTSNTHFMKKLAFHLLFMEWLQDASQHWHPELSLWLCWFQCWETLGFANIGWTVQCQRKKNICKLFVIAVQFAKSNLRYFSTVSEALKNTWFHTTAATVCSFIKYIRWG